MVQSNHIYSVCVCLCLYVWLTYHVYTKQFNCFLLDVLFIVSCPMFRLSALTSFWSLRKGKGTMALVAVVRDAAVVEEDIANLVEGTGWTASQPLRLKMLPSSLPWVQSESFLSLAFFPLLLVFLFQDSNSEVCRWQDMGRTNAYSCSKIIWKKNYGLLRV